MYIFSRRILDVEPGLNGQINITAQAWNINDTSASILEPIINSGKLVIPFQNTSFSSVPLSFSLTPIVDMCSLSAVPGAQQAACAWGQRCSSSSDPALMDFCFLNRNFSACITCTPRDNIQSFTFSFPGDFASIQSDTTPFSNRLVAVLARAINGTQDNIRSASPL